MDKDPLYDYSAEKEAARLFSDAMNVLNRFKTEYIKREMGAERYLEYENEAALAGAMDDIAPDLSEMAASIERERIMADAVEQVRSAEASGDEDIVRHTYLDAVIQLVEHAKGRESEVGESYLSAYLEADDYIAEKFGEIEGISEYTILPDSQQVQAYTVPIPDLERSITIDFKLIDGGIVCTPFILSGVGPRMDLDVETLDIILGDVTSVDQLQHEIVTRLENSARHLSKYV